MGVDCFVGSILGLAVADGLGAPWEGMLPDMVFALGPADRIIKNEENKTLFYTDDTQMTIGVMETLIEHQRIDPDYLAKRFAENYDPDRGYGQGARMIIDAIGSGEDYNLMAQSLFEGSGSYGNGAAMRVAPIGLFFASDIDRVLSEATLSAETTHRHPMGIDGAKILAAAVSYSFRSAGNRFDRTDFLEFLSGIAETEEFQWQMDLATQLPPFSSLTAFGNSIEAHRSVMTSVICFADSPDDYSEAVSRAIGQGDDVDTIAAMTAALSGARLGLQGIPRNLLDSLEDEVQGKAYLIELAKKLWHRRQEGMP